MLLITEFRIAALSILATRGEQSGPQLRTAAEERLGKKVSIGGFYLLMDDLEKENLVTHRLGAWHPTLFFSHGIAH